MPAHAVDLLERAELVVQALDREHRAADALQPGFDVPGAESRVQPDVIPAPEGRVDVVVVARQTLRQVGAEEVLARGLDAGHRHRLDEQVRRHQHQPGDRRGVACGVVRGLVCGMEQRDRGAVAVADQPGRFGDAQCLEQRRQQLVGLTVHVVHAPALVVCARRGPAVAGARIHQAAAAGGIAQLAREVLPQRKRSQALVQEQQQRPAGALRRDPFVLDAHAAAAPVDVDPLDRHARFASCSRSLKRWILPVAVFGRSGTNSICRGYL